MSFVSPEKNVQYFNIHPGMTVADFGAGSGAYAIEAAKLVGKKGRVYAIEIQKDLVSKVKNSARKEGLENVDVIWGDLEEAEGSQLDERVADRIIVSNILFQVKDKDAFLVEVKRVLKENGEVYVIDWDGSYGGVGPPEKLVISADEARQLFEEHGFSIKRSFEPGEHHWGFVAVMSE